VYLSDGYLRYNSHSTKERLGELNAQKLAGILPDKEGRKSVLNAVKGIASGKVRSLIYSLDERDNHLTQSPLYWYQGRPVRADQALLGYIQKTDKRF